MKNNLLIILGILSIIAIIAIIKNNSLFSFGDNERISEGWEAYENKNYSFAISQFTAVDLKKHRDVILPLADSYLQIGEPYNAIHYLEQAYFDEAFTADERSKVTNMLGLAYIDEKEFKKARIILNESSELGNTNSAINLEILDSLEISQKK